MDVPRAADLLPRGWCVVSGWALDDAGPVRAVMITLDDRPAAYAQPGVARDDVAALFPDLAHARNCGWSACLDLRGLTGNSVRLGAVALTASGDAIEFAGAAVRLMEANASSRRDRAVFTMTQNEPRFLPLWLAYYGRHFEATDIYVLDHDSTDGSTSRLEGRCRVIPIHRDRSFDHAWLKAAAESFQSFLLNSYAAVLYADVDEIVVANPARYGGLADYIRGMSGPCARCTGYNVVHYPEEPALRFDQPVLAQRRFWHPVPAYSKTLLTRVPLAWHVGFHEVMNAEPVSPDPDLYLLHLHRVDFECCRARHEAAARRTWSETDVLLDLGRQYRIFEPEPFREWFYHDADLGAPRREEIPDILRGAF
jgi:hypothetical protein